MGDERSDTLLRHGFSQSSIEKWLFACCLLIFEGSCCLALLALYKKYTITWMVFFQGTAGHVLMVALAGVFASFIVGGGLYVRTQGSARRELSLIAGANVIGVLSAVLVGEMGIRVLSVQVPEGDQLGNIVVLPKDWDRIRQRYHEILGKASKDLSYLVYDAHLGWRIAPDRQSSNGLYRSGSNGVRTEEAGDVLRVDPRKKRVALVGDSFTFGEEVVYRDTWAFQLQGLLGDEYQVVNFGVPGYGIDQMYLRYLKDVQEWEPDLVVFGFISNDLLRSTTVYSFLSFPQWDLPFSKPRFFQSPSGLQLVNQPAFSPSQIFSRAHIQDLPELDRDSGYEEHQWAESWTYRSYLVRLAISKFPRWSDRHREKVDDAVLSLNAEIVNAFLAHVAQSGKTAVLVYFPSSEDYVQAPGQYTLGRHMAKSFQPLSVDLSACLLQVPEAERFTSGNSHYSPESNRAVAACLHSPIRNSLVVH